MNGLLFPAVKPPAAPVEAEVEVLLKSWFPSAEAREVMMHTEGGPLWEAEWDRVLMLHWSIPMEVLQPYVPFRLDTRDGLAFVSAVAFTMTGMRASRLPGQPTMPFSRHPFLNLRTYVKVGEERGIYFLAEWVPLLPDLLIARAWYGLPFVPGHLQYEHDHENGVLSGEVSSWGKTGRLSYTAQLLGGYDSCRAGSLDEFLLERYTAFTRWRGVDRYFRVWHPPWWQSQLADMRIHDDSLLACAGKWAAHASYAGAHYSPGLPMVWMGQAQSLADVT